MLEIRLGFYATNIWEFEYNNVAGKQTNMQIAFFEKVNGEWEFSFDAFIQKPVAKASE